MVALKARAACRYSWCSLYCGRFGWCGAGPGRQERTGCGAWRGGPLRAAAPLPPNNLDITIRCSLVTIVSKTGDCKLSAAVVSCELFSQ